MLINGTTIVPLRLINITALRYQLLRESPLYAFLYNWIKEASMAANINGCAERIKPDGERPKQTALY